MIRTSIFTIVTLLLQHHIEIAQGISCASNPCQLVANVYDPSTGYCCSDIGPYYTDSLCTCPNNIPSVVNAPCRTTVNQATCSKLCANGGVCNIVNNQQVCWCALGYSGTNCEIQGIQNRCYAGLCKAGSCFERTIGASTYAFCQCTPGFNGVTCNQCYFTCSRQGAFPDTAYCATGRYFYCPQAYGAPVSAYCPTGQYFNRLTSKCDNTYPCT